MIKNVGPSRFVKRQYKQNFYGTCINSLIVENLLKLIQEEKYKIFSAYADFCKVLSIKNRSISNDPLFPELLSLTINRKEALMKGGIIKTSYQARNKKELPVLNEWVEGICPIPAEFIHLILYNKEQMEKEGESAPYDWFIVSIQTGVNEEISPMKPITMLRNALGVQYGGSGVEINEKSYLASVKFWSEHINIRV